MDIVVRGSQWITGTRKELRLLGTVDNERSFFRGRKPRLVYPGSRVYFVDSGGVFGFAAWKTYEERQGYNENRGQGRWPAFVVEAPWVEIEPAQPLPKEFLRGKWRWRYVTPMVDQLLKNRVP